MFGIAQLRALLTLFPNLPNLLAGIKMVWTACTRAKHLNRLI